MTTLVSVMIPALKVKSRASETLYETVSQMFEASDIEMFQLVPVTTQRVTGEVVFRINECSMSLDKIEGLLLQNEQLKVQLTRLKSRNSPIDRLQSNDELLEAVSLRLHKSEAENKKLRAKLKEQLIRNEHLREETQATIDEIKEEFMELIRGLVKDKRLR